MVEVLQLLSQVPSHEAIHTWDVSHSGNDLMEACLGDSRPLEVDDLGLYISPQLLPAVTPREAYLPCSQFIYLSRFFFLITWKNNLLKAFPLMKATCLIQISFPRFQWVWSGLNSLFLRSPGIMRTIANFLLINW